MPRPWIIVLFCLLLCNSRMHAQEGNAWPLPDYYHDLSKIQDEIMEMDALYPELVHWEILTTTDTDHLPLYAVKVSVQAHKDRYDVPRLLFVGQHHGEEVIGVEIVMYEMKKLLSLYGKDPEVTSILESNEIWFIPTVNPEGYNFVSRSFYPFRRKNNTDTNLNGILDLYQGGDGVDLNKSYDFNWENDAGTDPEEYYYKGPFPASEAETVAMQAFFEKERFSYTIQYHSSVTGNFSERIYHAWNWGGIKSSDYKEMHDLALAISRKLPRDYVKGFYRVHGGSTSSIGFARDYQYANYNTFSYDIECGGIYSNGVSIVRPYKPMYDTILEKHFQAMLELFRQARLHTFRGRILDRKGEPVANASIIYPDNHSPLQRAIHTNPEGFFFRYLKDSDIPFQVNLKYSFRTNRLAGSAEYRLPIDPRPVFMDNDSEALLYENPSSTFQFPSIRNWKDSDLLMNFFDGTNWIVSKSESVKSDQPSMYIQKLGYVLEGTFRYNLIHNERITDQREQEYKVYTRGDVSLSFCRGISTADHYWLQPHIALGVKFMFNDKAKLRLKIKGIRVHGDADGTLLNLKISDEFAHSELLSKDFIAAGKNGIITVRFPTVVISNSTLVSLENLDSKPWKMNVESSIYPCSYQNYVRYDEWQKTGSRDLAIELLMEN